ncbi:MAG: hypothetical protein HN348_14215 [Proteobacteria bacterium]|nr:hypothetical protein [Pseudomonadota bacterium]
MSLAVKVDVPDEVVAGYPAEARFEVTHCDGEPIDTLYEKGPVEVVGPTSTTTTELPQDADPADGFFTLSYTTPTDGFGEYTFRLGDDIDGDKLPDFLITRGAGDSLIYGPEAVVQTSAFEVIKNPYEWQLLEPADKNVTSGPVGSEVEVVLRLLDLNEYMPVAGETLEVEIVDALQPAGSLSSSSLETDADGEVTFSYSLSKQTGYNAAIASVGDLSLTVGRWGEPLAPSAGQSALELDPLWTVAHEEVFVEVTVRGLDEYQNPISGLEVGIETDLGELTLTRGTTDQYGEFQTQLNSSDVGWATVKATLTLADGDIVLPTVAVEFRPPPQTGFYGSPYPNPLSQGQTLTIPFAMGDEGAITVAVFDARGVLIETLVQDDLSIDYHTAEWLVDSTVAHGVHIIRLVAEDFEEELVVVVEPAPCGCRAVPGANVLWLASLGALFLRRRRQ